MTLPAPPNRRQPIRVFCALSTDGSASVFVGRSAGLPPPHLPPPSPFLLWGPHQQLTDSCSLGSRRLCCPHPHPVVPLPTASPQRNTQPGGRHLPHRHHCRRIPVWHVSPAMSATEEHYWIPGGPDRAGGGAGRDPSLLGVQASAWEGTEGVEEATALLASLEVSRALPGEQGWPQAAVEEECGREPLEALEMEECPNISPSSSVCSCPWTWLLWWGLYSSCSPSARPPTSTPPCKSS